MQGTQVLKYPANKLVDIHKTRLFITIEKCSKRMSQKKVKCKCYGIEELYSNGLLFSCFYTPDNAHSITICNFPHVNRNGIVRIKYFFLFYALTGEADGFA